MLLFCYKCLALNLNIDLSKLNFQIVENIARKYEVSKSDLLDCEADDLAVRVALGETEIIADTKKALTNVGVNVASLEESTSKGGKRSNHVSKFAKQRGIYLGITFT